MSDRKLLWAMGVTVGLAVLVSMVGAALAQGVPGPEIDPQVAVASLFDAINRSEVTLIIGCVVMLIVWILRAFVWKALDKKTALLPYLAVLIALLGTASVALVAAPEQWLAAIIAGVQSGVSAAGTWGLLGVARRG
jgi:hypothetical protein